MRELDLQTWPRRAVYELFSGCDWPFYEISFPLDVTRLRAYTKKRRTVVLLYACVAFGEGHAGAGGIFDPYPEGRLFVMDELLPSCTDLRPGAEVFHFVTLPGRGRSC